MDRYFKKKRPALDIPLYPIERIEVSRSTFAGEGYELPLYIGDFVRIALEEEWYLGAELPENAEAFLNLWTYHGEIQSNGHASFAGNTGGDVEAWRRASKLLGDLGQDEFRNNLDAFIKFEIANGDALNSLDEPPEGWERPYYAFDDRFYELDQSGPSLTAVLRDWLRSRPWILEVQCDPRLYSDRGSVIQAHPLKEARRDKFMASVRPDLESSTRLFFERFLKRR
ncbi:MAG: hypothetical protein AAF250_12940 [Pseudomonadota bacterium]